MQYHFSAEMAHCSAATKPKTRCGKKKYDVAFLHLHHKLLSRKLDTQLWSWVFSAQITSVPSTVLVPKCTSHPAECAPSLKGTRKANTELT